MLFRFALVAIWQDEDRRRHPSSASGMSLPPQLRVNVSKKCILGFHGFLSLPESRCVALTALTPYMVDQSIPLFLVSDRFVFHFNTEVASVSLLTLHIAINIAEWSGASTARQDLLLDSPLT